MEVEGNPALHKIAAKLFVDLCTEKFGWRDLSRDVVMDVGCGMEGFCGTAVLDKFPDVGAILGIDVNREALDNFTPRRSTKMSCEFGDIQSSDTLRNFRGKMTKVVSTHVFHQLREKEAAFRNVFEILKPDGEAGIFFVVHALVDEWNKEMIKTPKWKDCYKGPDVDQPMPREKDFREMAENAGFKVIHSEEKVKFIKYPASFERFTATFSQMCERDFTIPSELTDEFKSVGADVLLKMSPRNAEGKPLYRQTELSLLLKKPA